MTAFLHGQSKIFFSEKSIQRTDILSLSNSKAPSNGKCYILMSYNDNKVTKRTPHDDNGM